MTTKPQTRPGRMSSNDRRAVILDTACKLFSEKGYRGTTTRELASAAGVTEPVLYEHFPSKSDLYRAIIENQAQSGIEILTELTERFQDSEDDHAFFYALAEPRSFACCCIAASKTTS
jgi:AcrR family transcriptional regulator